MRAVVLVIVALLIPNVAFAVQQSIVGNWYEEATYGGYRTISIGHFRPDGTFTVEFRKCLRPGEMDDVDTGTWTYGNGNLRMITQVRDGFWVLDIEDYQTISNDGRTWIYKSTSGSAVDRYGHITFHDIRVTPDSKVPGCDLSS